MKLLSATYRETFWDGINNPKVFSFFSPHEISMELINKALNVKIK